MNWWKLYLLILLMMALFFPARGIHIAFYALAIVYWGGGWLLRYAFQRMEVTRSTERTRLFLGETAQIAVTFRNHTLIPLAWLSGYEHLPVALEAGRAKRWVVSLGPLATAIGSYSISGSQRGLYTVGPLEMTVGEPLGLHQFSDIIQSYHDIVVYPRIFALKELGLPSKLPYGNMRTRQPIFPDPARLAGVRQYQDGDSRQSIHWKLTARTGELQVKQFQHTVAVDTVIFLNLDEADYLVHSLYVESELAIETGASLANYLARSGETIGLVSNAHLRQQRAEVGLNEPKEAALAELPATQPTVRLLPRKGMAQLMRILEALAAAECRSGLPFPELLSNEARNLAWGTTLLVVTPIDSPELIEVALALLRLGYQLSIFVVGRTVQHPQLLYRSSQANLQLFRVTKGETITWGIR
ncbi:MAG: DUF58 domain-containing protein [Firmicutes bacterium]|nr:DUF58 domain-containing protein [Bacillota bacterium]